MSKDQSSKALARSALPAGQTETPAKAEATADKPRQRAAPRSSRASSGSGSPGFPDDGGVLGGGSGSGGGGFGNGGGVLGASRPAARLKARKQVAMGYIPDIPDFRDQVIGSEHFSTSPIGKVFCKHLCGNHEHSNKNAEKLIQGLFSHGYSGDLPDRHHLGDFGLMPDIENQGELNACTANAVISMIEFLIRQSGGPQIDLSRMFLYRLTRRLMGWTGDTGAYLRTTIKALRLFGCPPEADWPYDASLLDKEPDAYHYAYAQNFSKIKFARLDGYGAIPKGYMSRGEATLQLLKQILYAGHPAVIGFPVYSSLSDMGQDFVIPFPSYEDLARNPSPGQKIERGKAEDKLISGHAVMCVGYDETVEFQGEKIGALIIRNSWGPEWGDLGYAFLPYRFIKEGLALDCWMIADENVSEIARGL